MLMCLCYGVSCHEIKKIVQGGVNTTEGVQEECKAGLGCGCCLEALKKMVECEAQRLRNASLSSSHAIVGQGNSRNQCP